jgi:hypothetical protein
MAATNYQRIGWPFVAPFNASAPSANNHTVDANNDGVAWVFQARDANAITGLGFRYGARAGTPPAYTIGLEGVSATTGNPDGTYKTNGGNDCKKAFTPPADATWDGIWKTQTLDYSYTPTAGELLAITIRSGTNDAVNYSTFTSDISDASHSALNRPYAARLTAGSWAKRVPLPTFGVYSASGAYGYVYQGQYTTSTASTVGHRAALKFTVPTNVTNTFTVRGFRAIAYFASTGKTPVAGLWNAGGVVQNVTIDTDQARDATAGRGTWDFTFDESSLTALSPGTAYYIGLEVADAASGNFILYGNQYPTASEIAAETGGATWCLSTYNGSAWTDDTTVRPLVDLLVDDMTQASAGGGLIVHPGMSGGMRG